MSKNRKPKTTAENNSTQTATLLEEKPELNISVTSDTGNEPETEQNGTDITSLPSVGKNKKIIKVLSMSLIVLASLFVLFSAIVMVTYSQPIKTSVGSTVNLSYIEDNPLVSMICTPDCDVKAIKTDSLGKVYAPIKFFGFIKINLEVNIVDEQAPVLTTRNVFISSKKELSADKFVKNCTDHSDVTYSFITPIDSESIGSRNVQIVATDKAGNKTTVDANLTVQEPKEILSFELGSSDEIIKNKLKNTYYDFDKITLPAVTGCGTYEIMGENSTSIFVYDIKIEDTKAPEATVKSFDIPLGTTLTDEQIVSDIVDESKVTIEITDRPDFTKIGEYNLKVKLTDEYNNSSVYTSTVYVHDINTEVLAYENFLSDEIYDLVFNDDISRHLLHFENDDVLTIINTGHNELELTGDYSSIVIIIDIDDGSPPYVKLKNIKKAVGEKLSPEDFIYYSYDSTSITYKFEDPITTNDTGTYTVGIIATDKAGYSCIEYAEITIYEDDKPPEIFGAQDIYLGIDDEVPDLLAGVSAYDNVDEDVEVTVDATKVTYRKEGVYEIIYTAKDSRGNTAEVKCSIHVSSNVRTRLNIQNILQKPLLPNGCEVVSLSIVLNHLGYSIEPIDLYYEFMPRSDIYDGNPMYTYLGDATDDGLGCYAPCVVETGNNFLKEKKGSHRVYDVSGKDLSEYKKYINDGIPVIMWGLINMNGNDSLVLNSYYMGEKVVWHSHSHCLVLIGYTEHGYVFCDPIEGVIEYPNEAVEKSFEINFRQACIVK